MILSNEQLSLLVRCIGGGPINTAKILIFGNELGTSEGGNTERTIAHFEKNWTTDKILQIGSGFSSLNIGIPPVNSIFLQFISRMALAIRHHDDRFLKTLTPAGKAFVNDYIMHELYRTDTAIINLRPLPQSTERHWNYENINEKDYYKQYNFTLRNKPSDTWSDIRSQILKEGFELAKNSLILGAGDKNNKRAFFKYIFPNIKFEEITLNLQTQIYISHQPKIILSNYYDNRNGIRLIGLGDIFKYISYNKLA